MVDRQVRRTLRRSGKPTVIASEPISGDDNTVVIESRPEPHVDRRTNTDDRNVNQQPVGSQHIGIVDVDPERLGEFIAERADSGNGNSDGNGTRKRRADAGTKRGRRGKKETPANLEAVITMIHSWASVLLKTPELMLAESETKQLSDAYSTFCEYHEVPILTPKRMSEITLIACALSIYGTRVVAISQRRKQERKFGHVHEMPKQANAVHSVM